jgi:aminoglycoside/choline kinase family phosphotransferase
MPDRTAALDAFRAAAGWGAAERALLAGDASFRTYHRLTLPGRTAVLMDAPPPQEDVRPFLSIARHLTGLGLSAPRILAEDVAAGFLLLEDLGDDTYTRLLAAGEDETALYALAVDTLAALHRHAPPAGVPPYDDARLVGEAALLPDWFLPAADAAPDAAARAAWDDAWRAVLPTVHGVADTLVLRDYHVDNLLLLRDRQGVAACGLLDFQDAVVGPAPYDLMSLLEDARRDIAPDLVAAMRARYLAARPDIDVAAFDAAWAVLAAQRHAKVIGIFTRLLKRDGKPRYLCHLPRLWRLLERAVGHPACAPVQAWLDAHVPAPVRRRVPR